MVYIGEVKKEFGKTLRSLRNYRGYSQEYVGDKTGLHRTYISDIERGERNISLINIIKICNVLETKPSAFFNEMEKENRNSET